MRGTSQTWKEIVAKGEFNMESVVRVYGATGDDPNATVGSGYKEYSTITAPTITHGLLSGDALSVGNCIAKRLDFTLMTTDTIPKSAKIEVLARVKEAADSANVSEWVQFGTYWIDHRTVNDNLIDIEAYDAMKKGNQPYSDDEPTLVWPKSIQKVVQRIVAQMETAIDPYTRRDILSQVGDLEVVTKPDDDMVLLDILKHIGEIIGGNWTINYFGRLRFVPLTSPPEETNYIIDEAQNLIKTDQGDYLIHSGETQTHDEQTHPYSGFGTCRVPVVIGGLTTANEYTISRVTIARDSDHVYSYGNDTGYELIASESNPYATDAMAQLLYSRVNGVKYAPFEITNAVYDPAVELGDWVIAGSVYGVLYNEKRVLDVGFSGDMSAPGRDELEDEYPYVTALARMRYELKGLDSKTTRHFSTIEQSLDAITTSVGTIETTLDGDGTTTGLVSRVSTVEQTATSIQLSVEEIEDDYVSRTTDSIRSLFAMDTTNITLTAGTDSHGDATGTITFNAGTLIVNSTNFSVDSTGHMACNGADINGDLYCGSEDSVWAKLENGVLSGGNGSSYPRGSINFAAVTEDRATHTDRYGIQMTGDVLRISTNKIAVSGSSDASIDATYGVTYSEIPIVTDVHTGINGTLYVTTGRFSFINGLLTAIPNNWN